MNLEQGGSRRRQFALFFVGAGLLAMAAVVFDTTFNNYVRDTFHIGAGARGVLELPREFPGLAVTLLAGALLFLPEVRVASVAGACAALGAIGLAFWSDSYAAMISWMVLFSTGTHLMMPVQGAMAVGLADPGRRGKRLGQLGLATTTAAVVGCLLVWAIHERTPGNFRATFLLAACLSASAGVVFLWMRPHMAHNPRRPKLVFRRRYGLFYVLCALFGARKQIFLTFGPWVIITVFGKSAAVIALLVFVGRVVGIPVKPLLGRLIDRVGPRAVLIADAVILVGVCMGYAFAGRIPNPAVALAVVYGCYVLDDLLFAIGMARTVYVARIAPSQEDVVGTLAAGVSINHAVSMTVPAMGGLLWARMGSPEPVFLVAAGVMLVTFVCTLFVRAPRPAENKEEVRA